MFHYYGTLNAHAKSSLFLPAQCYASMVLAIIMCPTVCRTQVGVLLRRLNLGSHKQCHTIARDTSFPMPKILAEFQRGRQTKLALSSNGDFRHLWNG